MKLVPLDVRRRYRCCRTRRKRPRAASQDSPKAGAESANLSGLHDFDFLAATGACIIAA